MSIMRTYYGDKIEMEPVIPVSMVKIPATMEYGHASFYQAVPKSPGPDFKDRLSLLFKQAVSLNRENFSVFMDFSGHVEKISIACNPGGYKSGSQKIEILNGYMPGHGYEELDIEDLELARKKLSRLSIASDQIALLKDLCTKVQH